MRILIIKPSSLGDVVQAIPVLRCLKRSIPHARVSWWIHPQWAGLLEGDLDLDEVIPFHRDGWGKPLFWLELLHTVRGLRRRRFDWVVDLQGLARSGALAWLVAGRKCVGLDDPREGARALYDRVVSRPSRSTHAVDWYLEVLPYLGASRHWDFEWLPQHPVTASVLQATWGTRGRDWVVIQAGARWRTKRWPVEHFSAVIGGLAQRFPQVGFALMGGVDDKALADRLAAAAPDRCLNLAGQVSLLEMVEWIRMSRLMITNDTGPMHVAAAVGTPIVALFGPTDPQRTGPYGQMGGVVRHAVPCAPCFKGICKNPRLYECLEGLGPARVLEAAARVLLPLDTGSPGARLTA